MRFLHPLTLSIIFILLSHLLHAQNPPQIEWHRNLGGSGTDIFTSIDTLTDGGFILTGRTSSNNADVSGNKGGTDVWVVKISSTGTLEWQRCYGGSNDEGGREIIRTNDGGYILIGSTNSSNGDVSGLHGMDSDIWVLKLSQNGSVQWQKCYGGTASDVGESILQTADGGFLFTGSVNSNDGDVFGHHSPNNRFDKDGWLVKINTTGIIEWQKCFGGTSDDWFNDLLLTNSGEFYAAGYSQSVDGDLASIGTNRNALLVRFRSNGTINWIKRFGGSAFELFNSINQINANEFLLNMQTASTDGDVIGNHGDDDACIMRIDSLGTIKSLKCYGGNGEEETASYPTWDGGFMIYGLTVSNNNGDVSGYKGGSDLWLLKTTNTGSPEWQRCLGGTGDEFAHRLLQTRDKGFVVAGYTNSTNGDISGNKGGTDAWIIKIAGPTVITNLGSSPTLRPVEVTIVPNPVTTTATVNYPKTTHSSTLKVFDNTGRLVIQLHLPAGSKTIQLPVNKLSYGNYHITWSDGIRSVSQKLFVSSR
jgi:hypothetical protein